MLLSNADISWMQDVQESALPGTVVIERYAFTADGMGGMNELWTAAGTVLGRIYPMTRRSLAETVGGAQLLSETSWFATLPVGTVVNAKDRLLWDGRTWEILQVNNSEMWKTCVRCEVQAHNEERRV